MKIHLIAAARPNFMKIAPLYHALKSEAWAEPVIVHTGQHYDLNMSDVFFQDLALPLPASHLGVGSGTHAEQTGQVMMAYEKVLLESQPDLVVVVGDVNSTVACTMAAAKISRYNGQQTTDHGRGRRPCVGHLEAGLRSFDRSMPEEINRLVTDALADILWTPSADADENLVREGVPQEKIQRVGNIMIDSLEMLRDKIQNQAAYNDFGLKPQAYGLVTLHRPSNVDAPDKLGKLFDLLSRISKKIPLVFPIHPRTRKSAEQIGILPRLDPSKESTTTRIAGGLDFTARGGKKQGREVPRSLRVKPGASHPVWKTQLILLDPLNYIRFMNLLFNCRFTLTDSGGIQEETTYLGIPCITLRPNTERPITLSQGTNQLCRLDDLEAAVNGVLAQKRRQPIKIDLWDGHTAERVVSSIKDFFNLRQI